MRYDRSACCWFFYITRFLRTLRWLLESGGSDADLSPIVDGAKWAGFDRIALVNDTFLMPSCSSCPGCSSGRAFESMAQRASFSAVPSAWGFVPCRDARAHPVGLLPDGIGDQARVRSRPRFRRFLADFRSGGLTQVGPLWFVWLLLAFDLFVTLVYAIVSKLFSRADRESNRLLDHRSSSQGSCLDSPRRLSAHVQCLRSLGMGGIRTFDVQISRLFLYLLYFLAGVALGARGLHRSAVRSDGPMASTGGRGCSPELGSYAG